MGAQATSLAGVRLSPQQRHLWALQAGLENAPFHTWGVVRIAGPLDRDRLRAALASVVERHEILRTTFQQLAEMTIPLQVIGEEAEPLLRELEPRERGTDGTPLLLRECLSPPFDLAARPPLLRAALAAAEGGEHLLCLALPALCADAAGWQALVRELAQAYGGRPAAEPLQYADVAEWQNQVFDGPGDEGEVGLRHWQRPGLAAAADLVLPLPLAAPGRRFSPAAREIRFAPGIEALVAAAGMGSTPPEAVLLAAWQLLLARLAGTREVVVGVRFDGRNYEELDGALGLLAKHLPIAGRVDLEAGFGRLVADAAVALREGERWQEFFDWSLLSPAPGGEPLCFLPAAFELEDEPQAWQGGGATFRVAALASCFDRFALKLSCRRRDGRLAAELQYDAERLPRPEAERLAARFAVLLGRACGSPDVPSGELDLLTPGELHQIAVELNDTRSDLGPDATVHELFETWADRAPGIAAVAHAGRALTYAELERRANGLARQLQRLGVGPDVPVALCAERTPEAVIGLLGVLKAGGAYVPLDPSLPGERLALMVGDSGAAVLLTQRSLLPRLPRTAARPVLIEEAGEAAERPRSGVSGRNLAYVIYTSGSTGRPKGVGVEHRQLVNYVRAVAGRLGLDGGGAFASVSTLAADLGNTMVFPALCGGGCLDLVAAELASDPWALAEHMARQPVDFLKIVPSHLSALAGDPGAGRLLPGRALVLGGEAFRWELAERLAALQPACRIFNHYGPTETTVGVLTHPVAPAPPGWPATVPLGRPLANVRVYLLDRALNPVPVGAPGEIHIGGANVTRGYVGQPERTAERFLPDPFGEEPGGRLYRTGDLGRLLPDLAVEYLHRADDQVKVRGFRVEPGEVAAALLRHPAVRDAAVVARGEGAGETRLVAYAVAVPGQDPAPRDLLAFLRERLPEFMVPAALVRLPALPLTPNGKLDRKALPAPAPGGEELGFQAPRTPVERILAQTWRDVLRLDRIGVHDNFFQLGGDSILSIQVVSRANQAGLRLTPRQLFQHQTIAELAQAASLLSPEGGEPSPDLGSGPVPLTPIQHWLFEQELAEPYHFNQSVLLDLRPGLDPALLGPALEAALERHEALRLRFQRRGGVWEQSLAAGAVPWSRIDLSALGEPGRSEAYAAIAGCLQASLDLAAGPLARAAVLEAGPGAPARLAIVIHHLAVDVVSWRILLEDIALAWRLLTRGEPVELAPRTTSFQRWAGLLSEHAASPALREELDLWLRAGRPRSRLPVDLAAGGPDLVGSADTVAVALGAEETLALLQRVPEAYRTRINDVLLTALARALGEWVAGDCPLIELEGHGREEIFAGLDLSRTVGWLTTRFPVALDLRGLHRPGETLRAVKEQLRRIPERGIGYGLLRYLSPDPEVTRALAAMPVPEVSFNYLGRLDRALPEDAPFAPSAGPKGAERSPRNRRRYPLDVNAWVVAGRLRATFTFSRSRHRRETIEAVANGFLGALRDLVEHCLEPRAGGCSPSDFPLARLTQEQLDRLLGAGRGVEDLYPLSPLQQGLLFHTLYHPGDGVYLAPMSGTLEGDLEVEALKRAWREVIDRHPVLRSSFLWEGLERPLQLVHRRVELPWEELDWSGLTPAEQEARREELIAAQERAGFDLARAPLMCLTLARTGPRSWCFLWGRHHLVVDGWTTSRLLNEVFGLYGLFGGGPTFQPPPSRPYRDYIAWLERQDLSAAEAYWRRVLGGFAAPTPLPVPPEASAPEGEAGVGEEQLVLPAGDSAALEELARGHRLTLNTLLQGAWALLIAHYAGTGDVVFGGVVAGRPYDLPGAESIVGPFINTLPVRVRLSAGEPLVEWLRRLQEEQAEQRQLEHSPLVEVQGWSDVPRGVPLFTTLLVFENYPGELAVGGGRLVVRDIRHSVRNGYPLTLRLVPGAALQLHLLFDRRHLCAGTAAAILDRLRLLLGRMREAPAEPLGGVTKVLVEEDERRLAEREKAYDQALFQRLKSFRRRADQGSMQ